MGGQHPTGPVRLCELLVNDPVGDVADGSTASGGDDVIIWLRGGATYEWRTLSGGGWTLLNGNPGGTSFLRKWDFLIPIFLIPNFTNLF